MLVIDCDCGTTLKAANERELIEQVRAHVASDHPDREMSDDALHELVATKSYEASDA